MDTGQDRRMARADRITEERGDAYWRIYDELEAQARADWIEEFGKDNPDFPFCPDLGVLHRAAADKLADIERNRTQH